MTSAQEPIGDSPESPRGLPEPSVAREFLESLGLTKAGVP